MDRDIGADLDALDAEQPPVTVVRKPVTLARRLAIELLEREELLRDIIERRTDREDTWGRRVIEELKQVLEP